MGGSSGSKPKATEYYFGIHFGLGLPIDELVEMRVSGKRAWRGSVTSNGRIRINAPNLFGGKEKEGGLLGWMDVLFGEEDQPVLPALAAMLKGTAPAFRGISSAFYDGLVTTNVPYPKPWEFLRRGGNRLWGRQAPWYPEKQFIWLADGQIKAMNPVHMLYQVLTSTYFRGWPRAWFDDVAWRAAADTCYDEGLGLCIEWRRSDSFRAFKELIEDHAGLQIYNDRDTGLISITMLRDTGAVESLPLFDEDSGLLELIEEDVTVIDDMPSDIIVKYTDAIDGETKSVRSSNAAVAARGWRSTQTLEYPAAPTDEIAMRILQRELRTRTAGLRRYKVVLDRRARSINPADRFRIRSRRRGIEMVVVRAGKIEDGTLLNGRITISCVQDVFGLPSTALVQLPPPGWEPPSFTPATITTRRLIEVPYRDLVTRLDAANLALVDTTNAYAAMVAMPPSEMSLDYALTTRVGSSGGFIEQGTGDWCPTALTAGPITIGAAPVIVALANTDRLDLVDVGSCALIDDEILRVDAVDEEALTVTLARGCLDTVPAAHASGSRVWFYSDYAEADPTGYSMSTTVQAQLLTNTSSGQLDPALAGTDTIVLQARQGRPYPPGQFQIGGAYYPANIVGDVQVTLAHRDRMGQADQVIDTAFGSTGPEAGTTYSARLLRADNQAVLVSEAGITATGVTLTTLYEGQIIVELWAVRNGMDSWQKHRHSLAHSNPSPP